MSHQNTYIILWIIANGEGTFLLRKLQLLFNRLSHRTIIGLSGLILFGFVWGSVFVLIDRDYQSTTENLINSDNKLKLIKEQYEREGALTPVVKALLRPENFDLSVSQSGINDSKGNIVALIRLTVTDDSRGSFITLLWNTPVFLSQRCVVVLML